MILMEKKKINIFGSKFVENNKHICKMLIDNKEYKITKKYMNSMFSRCSSLLSLPDILKWNTNNLTNMRYMLYGCSSLSS